MAVESGIDIQNGWPIDRTPLKLTPLDLYSDDSEDDFPVDPDGKLPDPGAEVTLPHILGSLLVLRFGYDFKPDVVSSGNPNNWTWRRKGTHAWFWGLLEDPLMQPLLVTKAAALLKTDIDDYKAEMARRIEKAASKHADKDVIDDDINKALAVLDRVIPMVRHATGGQVEYGSEVFQYLPNDYYAGLERDSKKAQYLVA